MPERQGILINVLLEGGRTVEHFYDASDYGSEQALSRLRKELEDAYTALKERSEGSLIYLSNPYGIYNPNHVVGCHFYLIEAGPVLAKVVQEMGFLGRNRG